MAIKYLVHELSPGGNLFHGEKSSKSEAETVVEQLKAKSKGRNPFVITPRYVSVTENTENVEPVDLPIVTAGSLYQINHGTDKNLSEQPYSTKIIYEALAESATRIMQGKTS